jgi:hypothetical protein
MFKIGNSKIAKTTMISCIPTGVCYGEGNQCKGCYAKRSEVRFKGVLACRIRHFESFIDSPYQFIVDAIAEIKKAKKPYFRIHESGDFFSQKYIRAWETIIENCPKVMFYAYTKKADLFDFNGLNSLSNFNLVNGTNEKNYGSLDFCNELVKSKGYVLCPCEIDDTVHCMDNCKACLTEKKVCFIEH